MPSSSESGLAKYTKRKSIRKESHERGIQEWTFTHFKDVQRPGIPLLDLLELRNTPLLDKDCLSGLDVDDIGEPKLGQGNRFGGEEVIFGAVDGSRRS